MKRHAIALVIASLSCSSGPSSFKVGAKGATVSGPDDLVVSIPEGALAGETEIEIGATDAATLPAPSAGASLAGTPYAFLPHGLQFAEPVTIRLPVAAGATRVLRLDDESDATWEEVAGVTIDAGVATFEVTGFSIYAGATGDGAGDRCRRLVLATPAGRSTEVVLLDADTGATTAVATLPFFTTGSESDGSAVDASGETLFLSSRYQESSGSEEGGGATYAEKIAIVSLADGTFEVKQQPNLLRWAYGAHEGRAVLATPSGHGDAAATEVVLLDPATGETDVVATIPAFTSGYQSADTGTFDAATGTLHLYSQFRAASGSEGGGGSTFVHKRATVSLPDGTVTVVEQSEPLRHVFGGFEGQLVYAHATGYDAAAKTDVVLLDPATGATSTVATIPAFTSGSAAADHGVLDPVAGRLYLSSQFRAAGGSEGGGGSTFVHKTATIDLRAGTFEVREQPSPFAHARGAIDCR